MEIASCTPSKSSPYARQAKLSVTGAPKKKKSLAPRCMYTNAPPYKPSLHSIHVQRAGPGTIRPGTRPYTV